MGFFGPGGLTGKSEQGLDPQLMQALISQFPGLEGLRGQTAGQQQPRSLGSLGYSWGGPTLFAGQGANSFTLSPFEGAGGVSPESITGGLAAGTFGKSASQQSPFGTQGVGQQQPQGSLLSLPSLQLPMAQVNAQQGGISDGGMMGSGSGGGEDQGGFSVGAGDVLGAGQKALDIFGGDAQGQQTTTPGFAEQRQGERQDFSAASTLTPFTIPQGVLSGASGGSAGGFDFGSMTPVGPSGASQLLQQQEGMVPQVAPDMAAPGGSAEFALGGGAGPTDWAGAIQGGIGTLGGLYNLYGGIQGGDPLSASAGGLQALGGASSLLQSSPQLAELLGLGGAAGSSALSGVGGAVGGLGGLYGLYQGIQSGDPIQMATGALSAYQGGMSLVGAITGETAPGILTGLATIAPETSAAVASALTGTTIGVEAGAQGIATAISGAAAAWALPVAAVIQAVMDTIAHQERSRVQNAGFTNNPIKGALYSQSTESVGNVNQSLADLLQGSGDLSKISEFDLANTLSSGMNNLMPYYATAQGGRGAIKASDTITGAGADWAAKPYEGGLTPGQYTQNFTNANQGMAQIVNELMRRGVTYQQLGQLPMSGDWAQASLDAGNTPQEMFERNYATPAPGQTETRWAEGQRLGGQLLRPGYTPADQFGGASELLAESLGASMAGPDAITKASGLMTSMYGGPLWAALARSGAGGDQGLMSLINQNFDPWVNARQWDPGDRQAHNEAERMARADPEGYADQLAAYAASQASKPAPAAPTNQYANYWSDLAGQRAQQDPMVQQLMQYQQQLGQLQQQAPDILSGFQGAAQGAQLPPEMMAGGGGLGPSGGGIDLEALLRQLGYLR